MVRAVVMDGITAEVAVFIHIPSAVIHVLFAVKAVPDVAARNLLISHAAAVPKPQITDDENGTGELDVQIGALVVQLIHQFYTLDFGEVQRFCIFTFYCSIPNGEQNKILNPLWRERNEGQRYLSADLS